MPRKRPNVSKKLKKVKVGAKPVRPKKLSAARRRREARAKYSNATQRREVKEKQTDHNELPLREAKLLCRETESFEDIIKLLSHSSPTIRVMALEEVCPCKLRGQEDEDVWNTIFSMVDDEDLGVRKQVLHTLCDGSPMHREPEVINAIESFNSEADRDLRRMAHKVMDAYRRSGVWNIM